MKRAAWVFTVLTTLVTANAACADTARPKKVFAHYMLCYPVGCAITPYARETVLNPHHDSLVSEYAIGSRWRNTPLLPVGIQITDADRRKSPMLQVGEQMTIEQTAELEIKRAMRAGIDGFSLDVLWDRDASFAQLDAFFKVAEEHDYPFEITFCLDDLERNPIAIEYLLKKHGNSPKLARRDGKVLFFGYTSVKTGMNYGAKLWKETKPEWKDRDPINSPEFRETPEGWHTYIGGYREYEKQFNTPMYFHFCLNALFGWMDKSGTFFPKQDEWNSAAAVLGEDFDAVGECIRHSLDYNQVSKIVRAKGAEWSEPMFFQVENPGNGTTRIGKGTDLMRENWAAARANDSTLIQVFTWNDYTENTMLAPAYNTRYTLLDLNSYFVKWWKTGKPPVPDHDKMYFIYRKFPNDSNIYPFKRRAKTAPDALEVLTILPKPATIRVPGRHAEWKAPAGLFYKQLPLTPGLVKAEIVRGGNVVVRLESPEPITSRPFRDQQGMVCYSTEEMRHWKADFGDTAPIPLTEGEYGDDDHDGLPNWFEMYWFGKMMDWSTDTVADPKADPDGDGLTNIEEYLAQSDPTKAPKYDAGYVWSLETIAARGLSYNPDNDDQGTGVWHYLVKTGSSGTIHHDGNYRPFERLGRRPALSIIPVFHGVLHEVPDGFSDLPDTRLGRIACTWTDPTKPLNWAGLVQNPVTPLTIAKDGSNIPLLKKLYRCTLSPRRNYLVAIGWESPVTGTVSLNMTTDPVAGPKYAQGVVTLAVEHSNPQRELASRVLQLGQTGNISLPQIEVQKGERLFITADSGTDGPGFDVPVSALSITLKRRM